MSLANFHPAVGAWFEGRFAAPTEAQLAAWPAIQSGRHALIAAPTGSGKTLAAFLAAIDGLVREGLRAPLPDQTSVVYVSPLKALSNDIAINLEEPLAGIRAELERRGLPNVEIRTLVRTGDTPQSERARMKKRPPHILVTTPESLYVLLGSESGRLMLAGARTAIVDEIHALAPNKRGSHLALSLARLDALCGRRLVRIGLSATQKPIEEIARFLVGAGGADECAIVDSGHVRSRDLAIEVPPAPLEAVMSGETWERVYDRLAELVLAHRTTLVFVNTRRMVERVARHLGERLGKASVAAHHGSLAREIRLDAEQRLKHGKLRVLVATASLELGIDIGDVDLVCQLGSPRSIAAFLQRVGRSGHGIGGVPRGRLFPFSRDDLVECAALLDCVRRGELDALRIPRAPLDVLAQQIVAEVAAMEWGEDALYDLVRSAHPYAALSRERYAEIVRMLAEGFTTQRGVRSAYLHRDAVHRRLRARRGARTTALTSGGTIPDTADYAVVLEPQDQVIGSVNEDFAVESLAGDVFQLGNTAYRILRVERDRVRVVDAEGAPPNLPFWLGEAPGRSDELSCAVSRLREEIAARFDDAAGQTASEAVLSAQTWLVETVGLAPVAAAQIVDYLARARAGLGLLPTQRVLAMERFFDESGGTQLVIHSPFGSRMNRAWGLALRKRFCRTFNFELQAAATEDAIVLSLSTSHSFPLADVARYLHSATAEQVLIQALLDAPLFPVRWRWNATTALALPRFRGGKKTPPQLQRMFSEDLLAAVFPDQVACAENLVGERRIPDHPLVAQTLDDCLHQAMDVDALLRLLRSLEDGSIRIEARDLAAPSPLAAEILGARPYAFLDDAPLEERRTQAVTSRRWGEAERAEDLGRLDPDAIAAVREEAWPEAQNADELHEALMSLGAIRAQEVAANGWTMYAEVLVAAGRATRFMLPLAPGDEADGGEGRVRGEDGSSANVIGNPGLGPRPVPLSSQLSSPAPSLWAAAERLPQIAAIHPDARLDPPLAAPAEFAAVAWTREDALRELVRGRLGGLGPVTAATLAATFAVVESDIEAALVALETEGYVMRGAFAPGAMATEWCERHLLARIHRYTIHRLRREIEPVAPRDFLRFLLDWQRVAPGTQVEGPDALAGILAQLEGYEAPAGAWETEILPARIADYSITWLDDLCRAGRVVWTRLRAAAEREPGERGGAPVRATPIVLLQRRHLNLWTPLGRGDPDDAVLSSRAAAVAGFLDRHGASFFDEIAEGAHLLATELEGVLAELVARGRINADSFAGLRALLVPAAKRPSAHDRRSRHRALFGIADAGRWAPIRRAPAAAAPNARSAYPAETVEHVARVLLRRYGVVAMRLLEREAAWLPPWRDLVRVYQRLEARGEIRGGRFVAGLAGEQFALPEAIGLLRAVRSRSHDGALVAVAGCDPLNLVGSVIAGDRVPRIAGARVVYRDGVPVATRIAGQVVLLETFDPAAEWQVRQALLRVPGTPATAAA